MRIIELLEGKDIKELDFVEKDNDGSKINYDLVEDLVFFINHDDDVYRRYVYPTIAKCMKQSKLKQKINPEIFKSAILEGYSQYIDEYPLKELPEKIEDKICKAACKKMAEDFKENYSDGKYKD